MQAPLLTSKLPGTTPASSAATIDTSIPESLIPAAATTQQSLDHPGHGTPTFAAPLMATSSATTSAVLPVQNTTDAGIIPSSDGSNTTITANPVPLVTNITEGATPTILSENNDQSSTTNSNTAKSDVTLT